MTTPTKEEVPNLALVRGYLTKTFRRLVSEDPELTLLQAPNGLGSLSLLKGRVFLFVSAEAIFQLTLGHAILDHCRFADLSGFRISLIDNGAEIKTGTCGTIVALSLTWKWKQGNEPVSWFLWYREVEGIGMPTTRELKSIEGRLCPSC